MSCMCSIQEARKRVHTKAEARVLKKELTHKGRAIKKRGRGAKARARKLCQIAKTNLRARAKARREREREEFKAWLTAERQAVKDRCRQRLVAIRGEEHKARQKAKLEREVLEQRTRELDKLKNPKRVAAGRRGAERREESNDEVAHNLPRELLPLWRKRQTLAMFSAKRNPRRSRTEAFLEWLEENPDQAQAELEQIHNGRTKAALEMHKRCTLAATAIDKAIRKAKGGEVELPPEVLETLDACSRELGAEWDPHHIEEAARLEVSGAPF